MATEFAFCFDILTAIEQLMMKIFNNMLLFFSFSNFGQNMLFSFVNKHIKTTETRYLHVKLDFLLINIRIKEIIISYHVNVSYQ